MKALFPTLAPALCGSLLVVFFGASAQAATVLMAFGEKIAPYCFPESNSGIELEVIGEALAYRGHQLKPVYVPLARVPLEFKHHKVDAAMTDLGEDLHSAGAHYGDPAVVYDNVFITLKERQIRLEQPKDLEGYTVLSFQGANRRYPQWLDAVTQRGQFFAQANQELQVRTLERGRYDVVLSDRYIYRYHALQVEKADGTKLKPVTEHEFTKVNPNDYRPVFRDARIRDDFNAGLLQLKRSGRFKAIYDKYLQK